MGENRSMPGTSKSDALSAAAGSGDYRCVLDAWRSHGAELRAYLRHRLGDSVVAEDLLQDSFIKAMNQGPGFCELGSPRAWLFQVARNALTDLWRAQGRLLSDPLDLDELPAEEPAEPAPVDALSTCLTRVLSELAPADAQILRACEFEGQTVLAFSLAQGLSLSAAKARLLRARKRLQARMAQACQVQFDETGRVSGHTPRPATLTDPT